MIYKGKFYYLQISFLERKYILFILYLLIYQLVPSVTHLLYVTVWAMYVQVRALCVCAKAGEDTGCLAVPLSALFT